MMPGDHLRESRRTSATFGRRTPNPVPRPLVIDDVDVHRMIICRIGQRAGTGLLAIFAQLMVRFPMLIISGWDADVADEALRLGSDLDLAMLPPITKPVDLTRLRETLLAIRAEWQNRQQPECCAAYTK